MVILKWEDFGKWKLESNKTEFMNKLAQRDHFWQNSLPLKHHATYINFFI